MKEGNSQRGLKKKEDEGKKQEGRIEKRKMKK